MKDYITLEVADTIPRLLLERIRRTPDAVAYRQCDEKTGVWFQRTWREVYKIIACWQSALENEGLKPGDRVAIMVRNSMEWVFFDMATLATGLVVVPIYLKESHSNIVHIMKDSGARLLIIEDIDSWDGLAPIHGDLENLVRVLIVKPFAGARKAGLVRYIDDWICHENLEVLVHDVSLHNLATIVYTSGTTGLPKGVALTHYNIMYDAWGGLQHFDVFPEDLFLSFLPLTHMLERTAGYYLPIMAGSTVCYARNVKTIAEDMASQQPTLVISVPLVFQRIHEKIQAQVRQASPVRRAIFNFALHVGWARFQYMQKRGGWNPCQLLWPVLSAMVGKKVIAKMGGRLRTVVSGGAALAPDIWKMFISLGLPIIQGYGLSETSPILSVNRTDNNLMGSVGPLLPDVQAKIDATGEILVKGPMVMKGYWNNEEATRTVFDKDGWFHTGDIGEIRDGHLFITDRLKQIIVMSNGEKVPPEGVEQAIRALPIFNNVMVVGEKRPYLILVAEANAALLEEFARGIGVEPDGGNYLRDEKLQTALIEMINGRLKAFSAYAKIRKVLLTTDVWSPDNGMTTNTMKMRRKPIVERYAAEIETLYPHD